MQGNSVNAIELNDEIFGIIPILFYTIEQTFLFTSKELIINLVFERFHFGFLRIFHF